MTNINFKKWKNKKMHVTEIEEKLDFRGYNIFWYNDYIRAEKDDKEIIFYCTKHGDFYYINDVEIFNLKESINNE